MSWLLHLLRKLFGKSSQQKVFSKQSAPSSSPENNERPLEESVAVASRWQGEPVRVAPSAPLDQEDQSIAELPNVEPDTYRRIDAAPAATPGAPPTAPSFPTEVSELIASVDSLRPVEPEDNSTDLATGSRHEDDQLPEIHDLLPAVEPELPETAIPAEEVSESLDDGKQPKVTENDADSCTPPAVDISEQPGAIADAANDELPVARRDSASAIRPSTVQPSVAQPPSDHSNTSKNLQNQSEQFPSAAETIIPSNLEDSSHDQAAILCSFDITESETPDDERAQSEPSSVDIPAPATPSSPTATEDQDVVVAFEQTSGSEAESASVEESSTDQSSVNNTFEPEVSSTDASQHQVIEEQAINASPWPDPISHTQSENNKDKVIATEVDPAGEGLDFSGPVPEQLATKEGQIKLLFTLKEGNYHGYIAPDDGSKDILFHQKYINSDVFDDLQRGARVVATIKHLKGKVYATHVELL